MMKRPRQANFDESWKKISKVTTSVMSQTPVDQDEWVEQITAIYYLCMAMPTPLAEKLYAKLKEYLISHVRMCREEILNPENDILPTYLDLYQRYSNGSRYLDDLYLHLNYHFTKRTIKHEWIDHYMQPMEKSKKFDKVKDLAMIIWREEMIEKVHTTLVAAILKDINYDRMGVSRYSTKLRDIIHSFVEVQAHEENSTGNVLQVYQELFEKPLLVDTGNFYNREAQRMYEHHDVSTYMVKVIERLDEEELRLRRFIHHTSINECKKECVNKLIADHQESLLDEYKSMLKNECVEDLSRLYILIKRLTHGLKKMSEIFHDHVYDNGKETIELMNKGCTPQEYVNSLLVVVKRFSGIVQVHLKNDEAFTAALNRAMEKLVNTTTESKKYPKSSELLVRHADHILKKGNKTIPPSEIEDHLHNFIDLFKYVEDKDLFQRFYSKKLAHRLINNLSISIETEELAINGLKDRCGYEYTSPLQRMIIDMKVSEDLTREFEETVRESGTKLNVSFSVNVLQSGAWPYATSPELSNTAPRPSDVSGEGGSGSSGGSTPEFTIPADLCVCVKLFTDFYGKKHTGRRLKFAFNLSHGTVTMNFTSRPYHVVMSAYQVAIVVLFNTSPTLSYTAIARDVGLDKSELDKTLATLVGSKILLVSSASEPATDMEEGANETDTYTVNTAYVNKKSKFKLPVTTHRGDNEVKEVESTHHSVDEDRQLYIQAVIVRSMKSRGVLQHNELISSVISQSKERFTPNIAMIKKCIEVLIDKQYIERDRQRKDNYIYLA